MAEGKIAALAGATGFVGRRLATALIEDGWRVRALVRRPADAAPLTQAGVEVTSGDLADVAALRRLTNGADLAINCAGLTKARSREAYMAINRDGAGRFAAACEARVLLVSSLAAREPKLSHYAASKHGGEVVSLAIAGDRLAILRPPAIYGPGDRETLGLFRFARVSPLAPVPADPKARLALAHVDDVVAAILDLAGRPDLIGTWAVGGDRPEGYGWEEIMTTAWRAMGREPRLTKVPGWTLTAAAIASEALAAMKGTASIFNRGKAREIRHPDWSIPPRDWVPNAPAPRFTLAAGFADTIAWYRAAGWL
jgi:nucleoside-diphosphate-sugar epimerase